jgi:ribosomal protein RSM22 (predicted rRNA methylase)
MSLLPEALRHALAALAEGRGRKGLAERSQAITAGYRSRRGSDGTIATEDDALAYALARMPATFAAAEAVFERLMEVAPGLAPQSLVDVGCGPGTVSFAAVRALPSLETMALIDRNAALLSLAGTLAANALPEQGPSFHRANILTAALPAADLVTAGYVLAEIAAPAQEGFVRRLWDAARQALVLIEPGTPDGFARLRAARTALIAAGAHVAAPCTHEGACPMAGEDWCRFLVRVQRSRDHRLLKQGERPFEDEPYAYLAVMRDRPADRPAWRIVGRPAETKPGITLPACGKEGRRSLTVARRERDKHREFSRLRWGDSIPILHETDKTPEVAS